jgi:outer membrane protein OmpA-like peptidoglycan-associated protein
MDKQAKELEQEVPNAKVERVGEGIRVTMPEGILFAFNSDELSPQAVKSVEDMANILKKYDDTEIIIEGHTDNKGAEQYNQKLSERRAKAVMSRLKALGVGNNRLETKGYGFSQPVASNDTDAGRAQNRRVEVAIFANDELKQKAKQGDVSVE